MALDLKWLLSADDKATPVFEKLQQSGKAAADGIQGAFSGALSKFNLLTGAVGTLAAVAGGMMFKSIINETVAWELGVGKLANTLGMTTEQASIYAVAAAKVGVEQSTLEAAGLKLAKTLGSNEDVFKKLGVATRDSTGHLRSTAQLMPEVNQRLGEMKAGTDRNVIAMEIYGRSWNDIRALLKMNNDVMSASKETAERLHLIVGDEGVKQGKKYKENLNDLNLVGKSLAIQFGNVLLPAAVQVGSYLGKNAPVLAEVFGYSLMFVGKVAMTTGEWIGLMAYRVVTLTSAVGNFVSGNFAAAKKDWQDMVAAGDDFSKKQKERWSDWKFKPQTSKDPSGDQTDDSAEKAAKANKEKLELLDKELAAFKELQAQKTALVKGQTEVQQTLLKAQYDQGLISTTEFYQAQNKAALDSAQEKADIAAQYLKKEEDVLAFVRKAYGENSKEYQAELGKNNKAVQDLQSAQLEYGKVYLEGEEKIRLALKAREDEYAKLKEQTLEAAGEYVEAEKKKQEVDARSADFLKLKKEAEEGVKLAVEALASVEQKRALDLVAAQNKEYDAARQYISDVAKMKDQLDALNGKDQEIIKSESDLREGVTKEAQLRDSLTLAWSQGNKAAINGLSQEISLQDQLNQRLQQERDLKYRKAELTGQIVGYNNGKPVYADSYAKEQAAGGYVTNSQLTGGAGSGITSVQTTGRSPFVNLNDPFPYLKSYDVGTSYVPYDMIAKIHQGEAIIPADLNKDFHQLLSSYQSGGGLLNWGADSFKKFDLLDSQRKNETISKFVENYQVPASLQDLKNRVFRENEEWGASFLQGVYGPVSLSSMPSQPQRTVSQGQRYTDGCDAYTFTGPITFGSTSFVLPNVTDKSTAADLAREALPEIMRLMKTRFRKVA